MHYPGKLKSGEAQRKRCPQLVLSAAVAQVASQSSERAGICMTGRGRILSFKEQARQCGVYGRNGTSWSSMIESCIDTGNQTADLRRECSSSYPDPLSRMCWELCMMPLQQDTWESPRCWTKCVQGSTGRRGGLCRQCSKCTTAKSTKRRSLSSRKPGMAPGQGHQERQTQKLKTPCEGPYMVLQRLSNVNYWIQLEGGRERKQVVHYNQLRVCVVQQQVEPDPVTCRKPEVEPLRD